MAIINGTLGADNLIGTSANDAINGLGGADTISAGDGNDQINETGNLVGSSIDGGSGGWDSLTVQTNGSAVVLGANVKGIENISIDPQGSANTQNITITNDAFTNIQGSTLNISNWNGSANISASGVTVGNVNITGSSGNDTILGGSGYDYINGHGGNDSIDGGGGQNTAGFNLGRITAAQSNTLTLVKGAGQTWTVSSGGINWFSISQPSTASNELTITDLRNSTQLPLDGVSFGTYSLNNIQTLAFDADYIDSNSNNTQWFRAFNINVTGSGSSLSMSLSNKTFIGTTGNDILTGTASDESFIGLGGVDTIIGGDGNDYIDEIGNLSGASIDGGSGWDNLNLHTNGAAVTLGNNVKGIENFNIDAQGSTNTQNITITGDIFTGIQGQTININTNTWNGSSAYVNASALSGGNLNIHTNSGNDTILGGSGNDYINGHGGSDSIDGGGGQNTAGFTIGRVTGAQLNTITLVKGAGQTWTIASGGVNWFTISQNSTTSNILTITDLRNSSQVAADGNAFGTTTLNNIQTLAFDADYIDANNNQSWFRAFNINVSGSGSSLSLSLLSNNLLGTSAGDMLTGTIANDTINGLGGADTISAGDGNDQISEIGNLVGSSIDGGGGWDNLTVQTNGAAVTLGSNIKGIENINIDPQGSANTQNITITNDAFTNIQGWTLNISNWNGSANISASGVTVGNLNIHTSTGNDTILSGSGNDYINGHGGSDSIDGGGGQNTAGFNVGRITGAQLNAITLVKGTGQTWTIASGGVNWFTISQNSTTSNILTITDLRNSTQVAADGNAFGTTTLNNIQTIAFDADYVDANSNNTQWFRAFNVNVTGSGSSLSMSLSNKTFIGTTGNDILTGTVNDESFFGLGGADTIIGGDGNDYIDVVGNLSGASIDGGGGWDTLNIHTNGAAVTLGNNVKAIENFNINADGASNTQNITVTGDIFTGIQGQTINIHSNSWNGSNASVNASMLAGGNLNIHTSTGNDTILGGSGNDYINGHGGSDSIDGGGGQNTAGFSIGRVTGAQLNTITLVKGVGQTWTIASGGVNWFTISQNSTTSNILTITDLRNPSQVAADGDAFGTTTLNNIQTIVFDADYIDTNNNTQWFQPISVTISGTGASLSLSLVSNNLLGTSAGDTLIGTTANDTIIGMGGADTIAAGYGNDQIDEIGNLAGSSIDGGAGSDNLTVHTNGTAVTLGSNIKGIENINIDPQGSQVTQNVTITNSAFTGAQNNIVGISVWNGNTNIDASTVTMGSVRLWANSGNDTLRGGSGDDWFSVGDGTHSIAGNGGNDVVMYEGATAGVNLNLKLGTATGSTLGADTVTGITNAHGSRFNDTITLSDNSGYVFGRAGNDLITGGSGDDDFYAGSGNDTINGGGGVNSINYYDDGYDTAGRATHGVNVNLLTGLATDNWGGTDTLINIQGITGSSFDDTLAGDNSNNKIKAGDGNDTITGNGGNDLIIGGNGTDVAVYSGNKSNYSLTNLGLNLYTIRDLRNGSPDGIDVLSSVEFLQFADQKTDLSWAVSSSPNKSMLQVDTTLNGVAPFGANDISDITGDGDTKYAKFTSYNSATGAFTLEMVNYFAPNPNFVSGASGVYGQNYLAEHDYITGILLNGTQPLPLNQQSTGSQFDAWFSNAAINMIVTQVIETIDASTDGINANGQSFGFATLKATNLNAVVFDSGDNSKNLIFQGNDSILGNTGNDILQGFSGNDTIDGGAGNNTAVFTGNRSRYNISKAADGTITVIDNSYFVGNDGTDTLKNIQTLQFADGNIQASDISSFVSKFGPRFEFSSTSYHPRVGVGGWNSNQFFLTESPAGNYVKGNINQFNVNIVVQNNLGDLIASNNSLTLGTAWSGLTGTNGKPFTFTTNQDGSVKAGAFWFDKGSATGTSYSVKYESFNINLPSTAGVAYTTINNQSNVQTLLTGLDLYNYGWANSSNNFAIFWETPENTSTKTKTENFAFFDTNGVALGGGVTSLTLSSSAYATFGGADSDGNYVLFTYSGTSGTIQLYNPSNLITSNYAATGSFNIGFNAATITTDAWDYANKNANGSFANYEIALSGVRNNQGVVDFYQLDAKTLTVTKAQSVTLSGSLGSSRIQNLRLYDNATTVFAYQDGSILHLTEIGADGSLISDYTQTLAAGAIFDRIRGLSNGLFEIVYRQPGAVANSMNYEIQIFDTRSGPLSVNNTSTTSPTNYAGTAFNDVISISAASSMVMGSEGNDILTATASASNAILSYEYLNEGITANLSTGIVTATNAQGTLVKTDTIAGFKNIIGTLYNDSITGDANANMFWVLGGNDTINGNGGMDYAEFYNDRSDYLIVQNGSNWSVTDRGSSALSGTTTLSNVRFLEFGWDGTVIDLTSAPVNHAMTGSVTISGQAAVGQTLTASNTLSDADGTGAISYQWLRNGVVIAGATASTYQAVLTDLGATLSVSASYTDGWNVYNSASSNSVTVAQSSTSVSGQVYFWNKSASGHALINGASVSVAGSGATAQSQILLSNVTIDSNGNVTADVTANLSAAADSFDVYLSLGSTVTNASFTSVLSSTNFTVISSPSNGGGLGISGYGNLSGTSTQLLSSGQTKLGSISFNIGTQSQFQISILAGTDFNNSNTGQQFNVTPYAYISNTTKTGADGSYIMQVASGNYLIGATNATNNIGNAVSAADALAALKIAVGLNPNPSFAVSPYEILAADYNHDGKVTSADALAILKAAVQYSGSTAPSWQFVSETADLSQISRTNTVYTPPITSVAGNFIQNMVGLIAGDVNGSWTPPAGSSYIETTNPNYFTQLSQKLSVSTSQWGV